jgi:hypothetical protein
MSDKAVHALRHSPRSAIDSNEAEVDANAANETRVHDTHDSTLPAVDRSFDRSSPVAIGRRAHERHGAWKWLAKCVLIMTRIVVSTRAYLSAAVLMRLASSARTALHPSR